MKLDASDAESVDSASEGMSEACSKCASEEKGTGRARKKTTTRPDNACSQHGGLTAQELFVSLFEFYLTPDIVKVIVDATNAKATEEVVKVSRGKLRCATAADSHTSRRPR